MPFRHGYSLFSKSKTGALHEEARYGRQGFGDKKTPPRWSVLILLRYVRQLKVPHQLHNADFPYGRARGDWRHWLSRCAGFLGFIGRQ